MAIEEAKQLIKKIFTRGPRNSRFVIAPIILSIMAVVGTGLLGGGKFQASFKPLSATNNSIGLRTAAVSPGSKTAASKWLAEAI